MRECLKVRAASPSFLAHASLYQYVYNKWSQLIRLNRKKKEQRKIGKKTKTAEAEATRPPQQCLSTQYSKSQRPDQAKETMTRKGVEQRGEKKNERSCWKPGSFSSAGHAQQKQKREKKKKQSRPAGDWRDARTPDGPRWATTRPPPTERGPRVYKFLLQTCIIIIPQLDMRVGKKNKNKWRSSGISFLSWEKKMSGKNIKMRPRRSYRTNGAAVCAVSIFCRVLCFFRVSHLSDWQNPRGIAQALNH